MSMVIYTLTNTVNGKQYVGKTIVTAMKRFQQHKADARKGSETAIHRAIRKYTPEVFLVETIDETADKATLNQKEREWIAKLNTFETGYNMTPGGEGQGHKHSEETKQKLRDRGIAYFQNNPEARQKAAEYGGQAVITEETRRIWHEQRVGNQWSKGMTYQHTAEAKAAIGRAHKGKFVSYETRCKISEARKQEVLKRNEAGQFTSDMRKRLNTHSESPS